MPAARQRPLIWVKPASPRTLASGESAAPKAGARNPTKVGFAEAYAPVSVDTCMAVGMRTVPPRPRECSTPVGPPQGESGKVSKAAVASVVYVVDSDESVRTGLSRLLDSAGLRPRRCDSLEEFLRETPRANAACALVDVSGLFLCEPALWSRLRTLAATIPVIALSTRDDAETRRLARAFGARAFFRKPVDAAALLDSIDWVTGDRTS